MLFHSSLRKELARSFGATLVVLFTIVLTMLLIRTLGMASKGSVNPEEIMLVLGYTVLGRMPTILTLALFISIVSTLSRMYRDSEMIIWFSGGRSLGGFIGPLMRFSWPILLVILLMVLFVWPWANQQTDELRQRFETRGDLQRVQPGQFQESSSGRRVYFIDKDTAEGKEGRNVFISSVDNMGVETIISAAAGRIDTIDDIPYLMLNQGQRLEMQPGSLEMRLSEFQEYAAQIGSSTRLVQGRGDLNAISSWDLLTEPSNARLGELGWRIGVALSAFNLVLLALAATISNPRAGKGGNLLFTLFAFIVYFNFLNFGQRWVATGQMSLSAMLLLLHGGVALVSIIWLYKRHYNLDIRHLLLRLVRGRAHEETAT
jgi:lipopolysaccharide export system permease protein